MRTRSHLVFAAGLLTTVVSPLAAHAQSCGDAGDGTVPEEGYQQAIRFEYTGEDQSFTVPDGTLRARFSVWGAGGGGFAWSNDLMSGGTGGFSSGSLDVVEGDVFAIVVGEGGQFRRAGNGSTPRTYGGGGKGDQSTSAGLAEVGAGGGLSGVFTGVFALDQSLIVAGGGGGSGDGPERGSEDESAGGNGNLPVTDGYLPLMGQDGGEVSTRGYGGGGGGYVGGVSGVDVHSFRGTFADAGEGGHGFVRSDIADGAVLFSEQSIKVPPMQDHLGYQAGVGLGGRSRTGGNGLVVVELECEVENPPTPLEPVNDWLIRGSFLQIGAPAPTDDASTSLLTLPDGAEVAFASLSWTCGGDANDTSDASDRVELTTSGVQEVTADEELLFAAGEDILRSYRADVTSLVTGSGDVSVSGVPCGTDARASFWSLLVVFEQPDEPFRRIRQYEGQDYLLSDQQSLLLEGWKSALVPDARIGIVAALGDATVSGDEGLFVDCPECGDGLDVSDWVSGPYNMGGELFDGSIVSLDTDAVTTPAWLDVDRSVDIDVFELFDVPSDSTDFEIRYQTGLNGVVVNSAVVAMAIEASDVEVTLRWDALDSVVIGDSAVYTVEVRNNGNAAATDVDVLIDVLEGLSGTFQVVLVEDSNGSEPVPRVLTNSADDDGFTALSDVQGQLMIASLEPGAVLTLQITQDIVDSISITADASWTDSVSGEDVASTHVLDPDAGGPLLHPVCDDGVIELFEADDDDDGIADTCDVCFGDDSQDADGDDVPDDCDVCLGNDESGDSDDDGVCDDRDECEGDDATGDLDLDGVCEDIDLCSGDDATGDIDDDTVCDDQDMCVGDDATGDTDSDGICDDDDLCAGDDATGDADGDGVCDDEDLCLGDDATGDTDSDAICDDQDVCVGNDATGDSDNDGVCDDQDLCVGDDQIGDSDGDGICGDDDEVVAGGSSSCGCSSSSNMPLSPLGMLALLGILPALRRRSRG